MRYRVIYFQCLCYLALPLCIVSMHLTRCVYLFPLFLKKIVFEAAIYANKDVYKFVSVSCASGSASPSAERTIKLTALISHEWRRRSL